MGRNEAISWPKCSFEIQMPTGGRVPFRIRSTRADRSLPEIFKQLSHETHIKLPPAGEFNTYNEDATVHAGEWTTGHFLLVHNSLPPPAPIVRPVSYGVFNGFSFTPTRRIDSSKVTLDLKIAEFNRAVPNLGTEVRFFVGNQEVEAALLVPGQPYSVYPRKFKRPVESRAVVASPTQPPRLEGPLVNIQWAVVDTNHTQLCHPGNSLVPLIPHKWAWL
jgi:hypothetical protein